MEELSATQDVQMTENSETLLETYIVGAATNQVTDAILNESLGEHDHFYPQPTPDTSGQEILLTLLTGSLPSQQKVLVNKEWSKDYLNRLT
ncbi:10608_t:CDS:1, partial [Acaulospora morrowiae]